jgi:iron(III) transport system ATP-binding protein
VSEPKLLLLDEPLSNLDAKLRESMRFEIKEIQKKLGITVVYVTHDQTEAMAMSDRIIVMNRGVIQQVGTPTKIYRQPANQFVADFVGKVNFLPGTARDGRIELSGIAQSVPYEGNHRDSVILAVRPENIGLSSVPRKDGGRGELEGVLQSMFYLGDINDCRVAIKDETLRVIVESRSFDTLREGQQVFLDLKEFLVYEDKGETGATGIVT